MGQKTHPIGFRTGEFIDWKARWYAGQPGLFKENLLADLKLRKALFARLKLAGITMVVIERLTRAISIKIFVTRPGMVIGRGGSGIEELKAFIRQTLKASQAPLIRKMLGNVDNVKLDLSVEEVGSPDLSAHLVASRIVSEMERRMPARRVVMRSMERTMQSGALGVKVLLAGRIGGAEIARKQRFRTGSVPAQTLRANIDYASVPALLKRGYVGVKVWIHKKEEA